MVIVICMIPFFKAESNEELIGSFDKSKILIFEDILLNLNYKIE